MTDRGTFWFLMSVALICGAIGVAIGYNFGFTDGRTSALVEVPSIDMPEEIVIPGERAPGGPQ